MRKNLRRVRKEDYNRVILTECCPYEVPLIFSNFNFYQILQKIDNSTEVKIETIYKKIISKNLKDHTIPLGYRIRKSEKTLRHLSLLHPASQKEMVGLYKEFGYQILNACKKSNFSIRRPGKIASKYYIESDNKKNSPYKSSDITILQEENESKYLTSYYSYYGYTRLYKFFESKDFFRLEKKYLYFWSLDVTQCFDSIYTHSITWSLKTKDFSKTHKNERNTLGSCFDRIMQAANYNETSGIVIGPEASRIFAEIIFQAIDNNIEKSLLEKKLIHGKHYDIRRYVDDYYIFSSDESICSQIQNLIEQNLKEFKLNLNTAKTIRLKRPFVTSQTASLRKTKDLTLNFLDKILEQENLNTENKCTPKSIRKPNRLFSGFINDIKASCIQDSKAYELSSGYLVSTLSNTILRTIDNNQNKTIEDNKSFDFEIFFSLLTQLIFHFFTISPNYNGSISICRITHAIRNFYDSQFKSEADTVKSIIYTSCLDFLESGSFSQISKNYSETHLEVLNILIAMRLLGVNFLISREVLENTLNLDNRSTLSYFEIITVLFYIQDHQAYRGLRKEVENIIKNKLKDLSDLNIDAEKAYLLFDAIGCPYVGNKTKKQLATKLNSYIFRTESPILTVDDLIFSIEKWGWFSSWDEISILSNLEKKQLMAGY